MQLEETQEKLEDALASEKTQTSSLNEQVVHLQRHIKQQETHVQNLIVKMKSMQNRQRVEVTSITNAVLTSTNSNNGNDDDNNRNKV